MGFIVQIGSDDTLLLHALWVYASSTLQYLFIPVEHRRRCHGGHRCHASAKAFLVFRPIQGPVVRMFTTLAQVLKFKGTPITRVMLSSDY